MNQFWLQKWVQISVFLLAFAIVPVFIFWFAIRPPYLQILSEGRQVQRQMDAKAIAELGITSTSLGETRLIQEIRQHYLRRVKLVRSTADLLRYNSLLVDAMAEAARQQGLQVVNVELDGQPIKGKFMPAGESSLERLSRWPEISNIQGVDATALVNLQMPSRELQMTVTADYSKVFRFIDSLAAFPSLVSISSINIEGGSERIHYRIKIRGYYWGESGAPAAGA